MYKIKQGGFLTGIKESWTYRHFQLVIIMGLVLGIWLARIDVLSYLPDTSVKYVKAEVIKEEVCPPADQKCQVNQWAHKRAIELYAENKEYDLERYRLEAIVEGRDILISIMNESEYFDYLEAAEKFGY